MTKPPLRLGRERERAEIEPIIARDPAGPFAQRVERQFGIEAEIDWGMLQDAGFLLGEINLSRRPWSKDWRLRDQVKTARDAISDVIKGLQEIRQAEEQHQTAQQYAETKGKAFLALALSVGAKLDASTAPAGTDPADNAEDPFTA